ncbi:hypothetical protein CFH99_22915 [Nocardioides aromaticivorans]|uniref:Uncharacterized protein n=1 Tax=Nocardioides aromaticivorans TaxID=200618 RepID=A0ABX7PS90_9ACTN|nr:hypothetical protein [Nocardioides aromaticivorans]QSR28480.1 hypothetical protein CFH99_22915 [Nocardioides aromaticivorans]
MTFPLLLDDAAIFPPGNLPLSDAVRAHLAHGVAPYADLVGPLVVALADLPALAEATADLPAGSIALSVTVPAPALVGDVVDRVRGIRAARLAALEVAVPEGVAATDVVPVLDAALTGVGRRNSRLDDEVSSSNREFHRPAGETPTTVYVELPRDDRRDTLVAELARTSYHAKLRTGGVRADLYPDEAELAAAVVALVRAGVPFKATAGLHHALRNTDPETGFEQHGFLNLLAATAAAGDGAGVEEVAAILAERDARRLPDGPTTTLLGSIGTCSITEPVDELTELGLLPEVAVR